MDTELKGLIDTESHVHTVQPTRLLNCVGCWYLVVLGAVGEDEPDVGDELVGGHVARVPRRPGLQPPLHDGEDTDRGSVLEYTVEESFPPNHIH